MKKLILSLATLTLLSVVSCRQSDELMSAEDQANLQVLMNAQDDANTPAGEPNTPNSGSVSDGDPVPPPRK